MEGSRQKRRTLTYCRISLYRAQSSRQEISQTSLDWPGGTGGIEGHQFCVPLVPDLEYSHQFWVLLIYMVGSSVTWSASKQWQAFKCSTDHTSQRSTLFRGIDFNSILTKSWREPAVESVTILIGIDQALMKVLASARKVSVHKTRLKPKLAG